MSARSALCAQREEKREKEEENLFGIWDLEVGISADLGQRCLRSVVCCLLLAVSCQLSVVREFPIV